MSATISASGLRQVIDGWLNAGKQVAAPSAAGGRVLYQRLASAEQAVFDAAPRPANSIKEFILPRHERLFRYRLEGQGVELADLPEERREQVIVGARPCDAAALPVLDHVFNWGAQDDSWTRGRERTTVVALACSRFDDACFCTSVGSGPADERGADAMLFEAGAGMYQVKVLTGKGRALFAGVPDSDTSPAGVAAPPPRFDSARVREFLADGFENGMWNEETLECLGCGACAYTCPTCHCFDIVDEGNAAGGTRVRNWDSCQFPLFTLHASGHNPRANQPQRQRQRIYHKFMTYPERFGPVLCTGCGNCTRNCPVGLGVLKVLGAIDSRAMGNNEREHIQA
ncbi:MAG TPA: 4Fe-4S dicluster domain-containing protein [Bryobacteraceae bacterium]|nr:4Fe-4S dicluster domain-containing protein [Bryobacteraceae bacterium]